MHGLRIPPCETGAIYRGSDGAVGTNPIDVAPAPRKPDHLAVASILLFGAAVPPLSPFEGVSRLRPGYTIMDGTETAYPMPDIQVEPSSDPSLQWAQIQPRLDRILIHAAEREGPLVLLFSGGVDSAILAARLRSITDREIVAVNYAFGDNDPEASLARVAAGRLGLTYLRIDADAAEDSPFSSPGTVYPTPFGDQSTDPTFRMANAVVRLGFPAGTLVIDGVGADGCFGLGLRLRQWDRVYGIPLIVRALAANLYRPAWFRASRLERTLRILARSSGLPPSAALIAQSPFAKSSFTTAPPSVFTELSDLLSDWVAGWAPESAHARAVAADLGLTCANVYAQKADPVLKRAGINVLHPFLEPDMVALALATVDDWSMLTPKAPLKWALSRYLPNEMVYRSKSGFIDTSLKPFADPQFRRALDEASRDGPIADIVSVKALAKAQKVLDSGRRLPPQTLNILWSAAFVSRWYRTAASVPSL